MLQAEGAAGLQQWLADEEERKKPEFLKLRPKYYYYYEWMKERICATHPALPEPVMDKLLTMPANDLDLILQHKEATDWKVSCHLYPHLQFGCGSALVCKLRAIDGHRAIARCCRLPCRI